MTLHYIDQRRLESTVVRDQSLFTGVAGVWAQENLVN